MQIVIPMSGFGERFRRAGYSVPKPLIEVDGKPIISHVVDLFPGETDFFFVCNEEHLEERSFGMESILRAASPSGRIVGIKPHKLGPVHAVEQVSTFLDLDAPVLVNYCDFSCYWDWEHFKFFSEQSGADGVIPGYRGFHPHSLGSTNYAYVKETKGWATAIQEKQPFTADKMREFASSGSYFFRTAGLMLENFRLQKERELVTNGEYYVSMAFRPLMESGGKVAIYSLQHFLQWGTPEDLAEYRYWSNAFRELGKERLEASSSPIGTSIIPLAGLGKRFAEEGYTTPKPMIEVSGEPMILQATRDLPRAKVNAFVLRKNLPGFEAIVQVLQEVFPKAFLEILDGETDGQAVSAAAGLKALQQSGSPMEPPFTFGATDNGLIFDRKLFEALLEDSSVDVIVWGARGYPNAVRSPEMYGWVNEENGWVRSISVKQAPNDAATTPVITGTFTFKSFAAFVEPFSEMVQAKSKVGGEYYLDNLINFALKQGYRVKLLPVDHYLSWGTPNELRTFRYWQSFFSKWIGHPYSLSSDSHVPREKLATLDTEYGSFAPAELPK